MFRYLVVFCLVLLAQTVPELTTDDFDTFVKDNDYVFVKFYAPWCGHCQRMAPAYEELYHQSSGKQYKIVKVNCISQNPLCEKEDVDGFPTLNFYIKGFAVPYNGPQTGQEISSWMENKIRTVLHPVGAEQVHKKIGKEAFVLVSGLEQEALQAVTVANMLSNPQLNFYHLQSSTPFVRLYRQDGTQLEYNIRKINPNKLADWAFHNSRPILLPLDNDFNTQYVVNQEQYKHILVFIDHQDDYSKSVQPLLSNACSQHSKALLCLRAVKGTSSFEQYAQATRAADDASSFTILTHRNSIGYTFDKEPNSASIQAFIAGALGDSIERSIDTARQRKLAFQYKHAVKMTDNNFNETIQAYKYSFVEFYSPMCGHCVRFAPEFDKLAAFINKKYEGKVLMAAVDVSENPDVSDSEDIRAFPTFHFYVQGQAIKYSGSRDLDHIASWIEEISYARLLVAAKKSDPLRPFVAISGIDEDHFLNALPGLFNTLPVYLITGDDQFAIEIHDKEVARYEREVVLQQVAEWLEEKTAPVLVSLGEEKPARKLLNAMKNKTPLLLIVNKHERESVSSQLEVLEKFCTGKDEMVCCYVHPDETDYEQIVNFIKDEDKENNRLVWINTQQMTSHIRQENIHSLSIQQIQAFVREQQEPKEEQKTEVDAEEQIEAARLKENEQL